jgi:hypothetical protein
VSDEPTGDAVTPPDPEAGAEAPTQPPAALAQQPPTGHPVETEAEATPDTEAETETETDPYAIARIGTRARRLVRERIRATLDGPAAATPAAQPPSDLDEQLLDRIADEEADQAGGALLYVAVVHAVSQELGIDVQAALDHPAVDRACALLQPDDGARRADAGATSDAPPDTLTLDTEWGGALTPEGLLTRPPRQRALLLDAVHVFGIETLEPGDPDIELRLADVGIDVRKPSTAETIGRLRWDEIRTVAVQRPRRGLPGRRRPALFVVGTDRGEVTFELPGVADDEIVEHLEPLIARNCAGYSDLHES